MQSANNHKIICGLFRVDHEAQIPRYSLIRSLEKIFTELYKTRLELFCENPKHKMFSSLSPIERETFEQERLRRKPRKWWRFK
jgi:hypothetical protein